MTPLEKIQSMKMPFAELKGVTFVEATLDRVVARMLVRPDLCTARNTIHGGAVMAFADSVGAAATVVNLPADANGTTTLESKTNFIGGAREGTTVIEASSGSTAVSEDDHVAAQTVDLRLHGFPIRWQTRIETEEGKLVGIVTQTQMVL